MDSKKSLPVNPNQKGEMLRESNKSTNAAKNNPFKYRDNSRRRAQSKKQKVLDKQYYEEKCD